MQYAPLIGEKSLWNSLKANANKLTSRIFVHLLYMLTTQNSPHIFIRECPEQMFIVIPRVYLYTTVCGKNTVVCAGMILLVSNAQQQLYKCSIAVHHWYVTIIWF